jgi:hypothetical protein
MGKKLSVKNSNVQAESDPVEGRVLINIPIDRVLIDPDNPNIRGKIIDTTDIQDSIREVGVREPIQVREVPDEPDSFYLIAGGRRLTAARRAGFSHIPAILDEDLESKSIRRMMLASHVRKDHPSVVLDDTGMVIGGDCWAVYHEVEDGAERKDIALLMGVTPDVAGAYYQLFNECIEVKQKVAAGDMAITVYSLLKHQPVQVRRYVAGKRGQVSANWVRKTLRNWSDIVKKLEQLPPDDNATPSEENVPAAYVDVAVLEYTETSAQCISEASVSISKLVDRPLGQTDLYMLDRLEKAIQQIRKSYANS